MNNPTWKYKVAPSIDLVSSLKEALNVPEIIAQLLVQKNITTFEEAKNFFRPELSDLHDPFLMKGMEKAVVRIQSAISKGEQILVYGDYDVDGTSAVALMYSFLKELTEYVIYYQPDRYKEGYGISIDGIHFAKENGVGLLIALDCGIKAVDQIDLANSFKIDSIICDHHTPGEVLPNALAILNPKQSECSYPYKELCGCGIGFKLTQAYSERILHSEGYLKNLDLVAIATAADIVPLTGENRILAYYGLQQVQATNRVAVKTILELANKSKNTTISDLVFVIAPRVNAAGRLSNANKAVEMLLSTDKESANYWVGVINELNNERKELDKSITLEALSMLNEEKHLSKKSTVVASESWHKGVVGIVASRLIESHYKPTIVLSVKDGIATGSARSVKGFNVYGAIESCGHLLDKFGGHKYAAGLSLKVENLEQFEKEFERIVAESILPDQLSPIIEIDADLDPKDLITKNGEIPKIVRILNQFAPFGPGNHKPVFRIKNLIDKKGWSRTVGEDNSHLKISCQDAQSGVQISGIGFGLGSKKNIVLQGQLFEGVGSLEINEYNNKQTLQVNFKDIKAS